MSLLINGRCCNGKKKHKGKKKKPQAETFHSGDDEKQFFVTENENIYPGKSKQLRKSFNDFMEIWPGSEDATLSLTVNPQHRMGCLRADLQNTVPKEDGVYANLQIQINNVNRNSAGMGSTTIAKVLIPTEPMPAAVYVREAFTISFTESVEVRLVVRNLPLARQ